MVGDGLGKIEKIMPAISGTKSNSNSHEGRCLVFFFLRARDGAVITQYFDGKGIKKRKGLKAQASNPLSLSIILSDRNY